MLLTHPSIQSALHYDRKSFKRDYGKAETCLIELSSVIKVKFYSILFSSANALVPEKKTSLSSKCFSRLHSAMSLISRDLLELLIFQQVVLPYKRSISGKSSNNFICLILSDQASTFLQC